MTGYAHGFWVPGGNKPNGKGHAEGKVCPKHQPFGKFKGNVFHDNGRFGLYFDNQGLLFSVTKTISYYFNAV